MTILLLQTASAVKVTANDYFIVSPALFPQVKACFNIILFDVVICDFFGFRLSEQC